MQARMAEMQEQMARTVVIGKAGASRVKARVTAKGEVTGLRHRPLGGRGTLGKGSDRGSDHRRDPGCPDPRRRPAEEMRKLTESLGLPT